MIGAQIRAARGLLNMSVAELASETGLAINTIRKAEATNGVPAITAAPMSLIRMTLEAAGVQFVDADTLGPGVRFRSDPPALRQRRRP